MTRQKSTLRMIFEPLAVAITLAAAARAVLQIDSIPSGSMAPTLQPGDQIVVTRYFGGAPKRGDVVVFESPREPGQLLVKRVIGLPGELVDSKLGNIRIGHSLLAEPYLTRQAAAGAIEPLLVPRDHYYVLGDNRDDSLDSRNWGPVPRSSVVGRARIILWSSRSSIGDVVNASGAQPARDRSIVPGERRLFKWID